MQVNFLCEILWFWVGITLQKYEQQQVLFIHNYHLSETRWGILFRDLQIRPQEHQYGMNPLGER